MSSDTPRLRGNSERRSGPYPLGQIPDQVVFNIGRELVHYLATSGERSMGMQGFGDAFGDIFASAVDGLHLSKSIGVADVVKEDDQCAWSVKTIKATKPFTQKNVRLISGRNDTGYSFGFQEGYEDPEGTGERVLSIWNARVDEALSEFRDLRLLVLIRDPEKKEFTIFEQEALRLSPGNYRYSFNKGNNLEGHDIVTEDHRFTWQSGGKQTTFIEDVPGSARRFSINQDVPVIASEVVLPLINYNDSWISLG